MHYFKKDGQLYCQQTLSYISLYSLDGDVESAITYIRNATKGYKKLSEIVDDYIDLKKNPHDYREERRKRSVAFDVIKLDVGNDGYSDDKQLNIIGIRKALPSEVEAYERVEKEKADKQLEQKRLEYEKLKKELGK